LVHPLALPRAATYAGSVVNESADTPNPGESPADGSLLPAESKTDLVAQLMASGKLRIPCGVYRFKTHEEADAWWDEMLARSQPKA